MVTRGPQIRCLVGPTRVPPVEAFSTARVQKIVSLKHFVPFEQAPLSRHSQCSGIKTGYELDRAPEHLFEFHLTGSDVETIGKRTKYGHVTHVELAEGGPLPETENQISVFIGPDGEDLHPARRSKGAQ